MEMETESYYVVTVYGLGLVYEGYQDGALQATRDYVRLCREAGHVADFPVTVCRYPDGVIVLVVEK